MNTLLNRLSGISCLFFYPNINLLLVGEYHNGSQHCNNCTSPDCLNINDYVKKLIQNKEISLMIEDYVVKGGSNINGIISSRRYWNHCRNIKQCRDVYPNLNYIPWDVRAIRLKDDIKRHPIFVLAIFLDKNQTRLSKKYDLSLKKKFKINLELIIDWIINPSKKSKGKKIIKKYYHKLGLPYFKSYSKYNYKISRIFKKINNIIPIKNHLLNYYLKYDNDRIFIDVANNVIPDIYLYYLVNSDTNKNTIVYGGRHHILSLKYLLKYLNNNVPTIDKDIIHHNKENQCMKFNKSIKFI